MSVRAITIGMNSAVDSPSVIRSKLCSTAANHTSTATILTQRSCYHEQLRQGDTQDMERPYGRLIRADDAVYIDTNNMNQKEVTQKISELIP